MAQFVKVGDKYINLDHVSHVAVQEKTLAVCFTDYKGEGVSAFCKMDDPAYPKLLSVLEG